MKQLDNSFRNNSGCNDSNDFSKTSLTALARLFESGLFNFINPGKHKLGLFESYLGKLVKNDLELKLNNTGDKNSWFISRFVWGTVPRSARVMGAAVPGAALLLVLLLLLPLLPLQVLGPEPGAVEFLNGSEPAVEFSKLSSRALADDFGLVDEGELTADNGLAGDFGLPDERELTADNGLARDFGLVDEGELTAENGLAGDYGLPDEGELTAETGMNVHFGSDQAGDYLGSFDLERGMTGISGFGDVMGVSDREVSIPGVSAKNNSISGISASKELKPSFAASKGLMPGISGRKELMPSFAGSKGLMSGFAGRKELMPGFAGSKGLMPGVSGNEIDQRVQSGQWKTLVTENFEIHFQAELEALAVKSAEIAEEIHEAIADDYLPGRDEKTHLIVVDDSDMSSGLADPGLLDQIIINPSHPVMREFGGRHESWLKLLIAHEYTHILHLNMRSETLEGLRGILGDIPTLMNPNFFQTWWMIEGYPILEESAISGGGRAQDAIYDMYMRMAFLEDEVYHFDQIHGQYNLESWPPGGMSVYLYGANFFDYLAREYSREELIEVSREYARHPSRGIAEAFEEILGRGAYELFQDWQIDRLEEYEKQAAEIRAEGEVSGERLSETGYYSYRPAWNPVREELVFYHLGYYFPGLRSFDLESREDSHLKSGYLVPTGLTVTAEGEILYALAEEDYFDIYRFDPESGNEERLTEGERARDPVLLESGELIYISQRAGMTEVRKKMIADGSEGAGDGGAGEVSARDSERTGFNWGSTGFEGDSGLAAQGDSTAIGENNDISGIRGNSEAEVLLGPGEKRQYFSPAVNPEEDLLALVIWKPGGYRDLYLYDLAEESLLRITESREAVFSPTWTPEGDRILFQADKDGINNLYAYDLAEEQFYQVTNVVGGAFDPLVVEEQDKIIYVGYDSSGYNLFALDYAQEDWQAVEFPGGAVNREVDRGLLDQSEQELLDQSEWGVADQFGDVSQDRVDSWDREDSEDLDRTERDSEHGDNEGREKGNRADEYRDSEDRDNEDLDITEMDSENRGGEDRDIEDRERVESEKEDSTGEGRDIEDSDNEYREKGDRAGEYRDSEEFPEGVYSTEDREREELEIRDYSVLRYLAPRYYLPNFMIGTAGSNLGLTIGGRDPLDRINYQAGFSFEGMDYPLSFNWSMLFNFDNFQLLQSSQRVAGRRFRDDERKLEDTHLLQLVVPVREQVFSAAALGGGLLYFRRDFETERPVQEQYRAFAAGNYLQSWGRNDLFALRDLYLQGNIDHFGEEYYLSTQMDWREYLDWRDYELSLRGSLAFGQYEESFTLGGLVGRYPVRGYLSAERVQGNELYYLRGQLGRRLVDIKRGFGLSPVFFDNISAAFFLEGGRISNPEEEKWLAGLGGELSLDMEFSYGLYPLELNLGAARKLAEDDWQVYLMTGYSF